MNSLFENPTALDFRSYLVTIGSLYYAFVIIMAGVIALLVSSYLWLRTH
jgi:hypothetical protein